MCWHDSRHNGTPCLRGRTQPTWGSLEARVTPCDAPAAEIIGRPVADGTIEAVP
jgi:hypothetical protein